MSSPTSSSSSIVDYYAVLEVSSTSSLDDIRRAYRRLALRWHPDKNRLNELEAEAKFKLIAEAFSVLSDPQARSSYDDEVENERQQQAYREQQQQQQQAFNNNPFRHRHFQRAFTFGDADAVFRAFFAEAADMNYRMHRNMGMNMGMGMMPMMGMSSRMGMGMGMDMSPMGFHHSMHNSLFDDPSFTQPFPSMFDHHHYHNNNNNNAALIGQQQQQSMSSSSSLGGAGSSFSSSSTQTRFINGIQTQVTTQSQSQPDGSVVTTITTRRTRPDGQVEQTREVQHTPPSSLYVQNHPHQARLPSSSSPSHSMYSTRSATLNF